MTVEPRASVIEFIASSISSSVMSSRSLVGDALALAVGSSWAMRLTAAAESPGAKPVRTYATGLHFSTSTLISSLEEANWSDWSAGPTLKPLTSAVAMMSFSSSPLARVFAAAA
ncbi:hypothetical protein ACRJ4B_33835 [Streptomyces sp. GTA36]